MNSICSATRWYVVCCSCHVTPRDVMPWYGIAWNGTEWHGVADHSSKEGFVKDPHPETEELLPWLQFEFEFELLRGTL